MIFNIKKKNRIIIQLIIDAGLKKGKNNFIRNGIYCV